MTKNNATLASWNVNGVRAASKNGLLRWLEHSEFDVVALQEIKARPDQLEPTLVRPAGYDAAWFPAEKAGYSGVAVWSRLPILDVRHGLGVAEFDVEGRVLEVEFRAFTLLNAYFPNSQFEGARLAYKLRFCEAILARCEALRAQGRGVVLCGDYNIAHREIDLRNPKQNVRNAGFLPEERAWMESFLGRGYVDTFRRFEVGGGHYSWWSYRPGVREKNVGWRIDYHCVNDELADRLRGASIQADVRGSDHCPVTVSLAL